MKKNYCKINSGVFNWQCFFTMIMPFVIGISRYVLAYIIRYLCLSTALLQIQHQQQPNNSYKLTKKRNLWCIDGCSTIPSNYQRNHQFLHICESFHSFWWVDGLKMSFWSKWYIDHIWPCYNITIRGRRRFRDIVIWVVQVKQSTSDTCSDYQSLWSLQMWSRPTWNLRRKPCIIYGYKDIP